MAEQEFQLRLFDEVKRVENSPTEAVNSRLFEQAELVLPEMLRRDELLDLITRLASLLSTIQSDPSPIVSLLTKLSEPLSYTDVLNFGDLPYIQGLAIGEEYVGFNRLIITLLSKATRHPTDAAHVAGKLDLMHAVVVLWLATPDSGVAGLIHDLLLGLLQVDRQIPPAPDAHLPSGGQGMMWKRIFGDVNIYAVFFDACSLTGANSLELSKSQRTLAQSRLMAWLPAVGKMDWSAIARSHHPSIEAIYGVKEGLLEFAVLRMVDAEQDILMHRVLIDFYSDLLHTFKPESSDTPLVHDSVALRYLIEQGVHEKTASLYLSVPGLEPDNIDLRFVYGPAANYIATYASSYPDHFLTSSMPKRVNNRLMRALDRSPARWFANADSPKHDLHVTASVPRATLLPGGDGSGSWTTSPLSLLPPTAPSQDVLLTLATIFNGPEAETLTFPAAKTASDPSEGWMREASAARALYFHYIYNNPRLWKHIVDHANVVAMTDVALAAISMFTAISTAKWALKPAFVIPGSILAVQDGPTAIFAPSAMPYPIDYLLSPPLTFSNLVGGRGDAESAAYKVATAKYEALSTLYSRLHEELSAESLDAIRNVTEAMKSALDQGPFGRAGQDVGGRIGTLDL